MTDTIKFHNADKIKVKYPHINDLKNNPDNIQCFDFDINSKYQNITPEITIGPVTDRVNCIKSTYMVQISILSKEIDSIYLICLNNFNNYMTDSEIGFTTDYKHFKKHFKIISASKIDPCIPMTETDMI